MSNTYCGRKTKVPKGKVQGTPNQCFLKGRKSGYIGGISLGLIKLDLDSLNSLRKDVVREIAYRFGVMGYSNMTKQVLIENILRNKGNVKTFNLDNLKL